LEPHPVSGEVEVDWDYDAKTRYRRLDPETIQALVVVEDLGLTFQLVYCVGDQEGGGDGWRVGEVSVADKSSPFGAFGGYSSVSEAEKAFEGTSSTKPGAQSDPLAISSGFDAFEEDDDGYWDRYDGTPARTPARSPALKRSPAPQSMQTSSSQLGDYRSASAEDAYYAQYDSVQPAMDNDDPDGKPEHVQVAPPLGLGTVERMESNELNETNGTWTLAERERSPSIPEDDERTAALVHPRPASSASSNGSQTVAKLEETAGRQEQNEFGVKQHVSRSIRSLYLLSRASGIDREEFERLVKTELDVLGLVQDQD
jgi:hypothetical protein